MPIRRKARRLFREGRRADPKQLSVPTEAQPPQPCVSRDEKDLPVGGPVGDGEVTVNCREQRFGFRTADTFPIHTRMWTAVRAKYDVTFPSKRLNVTGAWQAYKVDALYELMQITVNGTCNPRA